MGEKQQRAVAREVIKSYTYVIVWMCISIAVILFNKWLLAYSGFPYPIALTMWHMFFCSSIAFVAVRVLGVVKSHNMSAREYATRVMPIGLLYAGSLWLSNSAYLYLSVSFIQMTKSLMPGLVYGCGCFVGTERWRGNVALNMGLIAAGVVVCAVGEVNLVAKGLAQQLTALGFEAMRLTLVQVLMTGRGLAMNPMQSLYYVSPACLISLLVPFVFVEVPHMRAAKALHFSAPVLLSNALAAFALNLAVFLLIGKTSALTMNIAGVIKDWMLIFFSYYLFHAPVTALNLAGYFFCCSGVVWYNHMKLRDIKERVAAQHAGGGGGGGAGKEKAGEDEERQPLVDVVVTHRSKVEILSEIRRLQEEMEALDKRVGAGSSSSRLTALGALEAGGGGGGGAVTLAAAGGVGSSSALSGLWAGGGELKSRAAAAAGGGAVALAPAAAAAAALGGGGGDKDV